MAIMNRRRGSVLTLENGRRKTDQQAVGLSQNVILKKVNLRFRSTWRRVTIGPKQNQDAEGPSRSAMMALEDVQQETDQEAFTRSTRHDCNEKILTWNTLRCLREEESLTVVRE